MRILSGAAMLWLLMRWQTRAPLKHGSWRSALALFVYVAAFSFAYLTLAAGTGALLLFGAVQVTMLVAGFLKGERMGKVQSLGFVAALIGLVILVLPSLEAPTLAGSVLMLVSGIAWGMYSLFGRGLSNPAATTAGNFLRAVPLTLIPSVLALPSLHWDARGVLYAVLSGAFASGLGYVLWYRVLQHMRAMTASTIQLSAPVLAALGGVVWLDESLTRNLLVAMVLVLGGILLVSRSGKTGH